MQTRFSVYQSLFFNMSSQESRDVDKSFNKSKKGFCIAKRLLLESLNFHLNDEFQIVVKLKLI